MKQDNLLFTEFPGTEGNIGVATLNRPKVLNALSHEMILALNKQLTTWEQQSDIKAVVIRANNGKAFCAGGDLNDLYELAQNKQTPSAQFFWDEYQLNRRIKNYRKPYIAFLDGITMGGGAGISLHGSHAVLTERTRFAMPETGIGFFPDIGGSYFLPRFTGETGIYLALTGVTLNAADTHYVDAAEYLVNSDTLDALLQKLARIPFEGDVFSCVTRIITSLASSPGEPALAQHADKINQCFQYDSMETILENLTQHQDDWCQQTVELLKQKSPTSLKVTLAQLRQGGSLAFDDCLKMEYRLANRFLHHHDFYEGIRAILVDKDKKPKWQPQKLAEVSAETVAAFFAPLDTAELTFAE